MTIKVTRNGNTCHGNNSMVDWRMEGEDLLKKREIDLAIPHFQRATESFPKNPDAWLGLGRAFLTQGDLESACPAFEKCLSLDPASYWAPRLLFFSEAVRGNSARSLSLIPLMQGDAFVEPYGLLLEAMYHHSESWRGKARRALVWLKNMGLRDHYTVRCLRMMLSFPRRFFLSAAANAIWQGRHQLRNDVWLEVILRDRLRYLGDRNEENIIRLCWLALTLSENEAAAAIAAEGHARHPKEAAYSILEGHARFCQDNLPGALEIYKLATASDPGDWRGWLQLGACQIYAGETSRGSEVFANAGHRFPRDPIAAFLTRVSKEVLELTPHAEGLSVSGSAYPNGIPQAGIPDFKPAALWKGAPWLEDLTCVVGMRQGRREHRPVLRHRHPCSSCPACDSTYLQPFLINRASGMSLSRCTHCGHVFSDPMPTAEGLNLLYNHGYFDRSWSKFTELVTRLFQNGMTPLPTYPVYDRLQDWLARMDPVWWGEGGRGRQALDLGCADGAFMLGLRNRGWKVMGQDVSSRFESYYETLEIPFFPGPSTELKIEESSIDLCTMTHVIEHLSSPAEVFHHIYTWLKPGGRLLLMTPCCGTLTAWLGGKQWYYMTEHVHFFTPQSLMRLGQRMGFQPLYWRTRVGVQYETPFRAWRRNLMGGPLEKLFEALGHGDVIELVLEKETKVANPGNQPVSRSSTG